MDAPTPPNGLFGPLPVRKLDTEQTKSDKRVEVRRRDRLQRQIDARLDKIGRVYEHYTPPASALETWYRHGGWEMNRKLVREALVRCHCPAPRLERFDRCGSDAWYQVSDDGEKTRVSANYCGDRFCIPCGNARARKIRWSLEQLMTVEPHLFVTLTLRDDGKTLNEKINHLLASFARLRNQKFWEESVKAGAFFIEITRGADGRHWHVHLHAVVCGSWLDNLKLSNAWRLASGGSFIVHVRRVTDTKQAAGYLAKYATKGFDNSVIKQSDSLIEAIIALRGRRLVSTFGAWRGRRLDGPEKAGIVWKSIAPLHTIYSAAHKGEAWAKLICRAIQCGDVSLWADLPDENDST